MTRANAQDRWLALLRRAWEQGTLVKITLGTYRGSDITLQKVFVRPVELRAGLRLSFLFRHTTRDVTKNCAFNEGLERIKALLGAEFRAAHLFTTEHWARLQFRDGAEPRLVIRKADHAGPASRSHDREKKRWLDPKRCPWLQALGVTTADGRVRKGMEAKFRQIQQFLEVLCPLVEQASGLIHCAKAKPACAATGMEQASGQVGRTAPESAPAVPPRTALRVVDMGCGKGYLTFAAYDCLRRAGWPGVQVRGVEARPELAQFCDQMARQSGFDGLSFQAGTIASTVIEPVDVLVALHACDTATDDALAKGILAGAALLVVAPCCHKEVRPQLRPPPVLAPGLRHGILRERQAELVTDALRAALLEWAGYRTRVFEFISTEHTAKNLMITAVRRPVPLDRGAAARRVRELAAFYGVRSQRLAANLGFDLGADRRPNA